MRHRADSGPSRRVGPVLLALLPLAAAAATPVALALPPPAAPNGPQVHEPCGDLDKLDYDPAVGQIVCDGTTWQRSVTPVGVRNPGVQCNPDEIGSMMSTSPDGHLIWCPADPGVWVPYRP